MHTDWTTALSDYARRLHAAAPDGHHVASPLGAWMLLALTAPAARGPARDALADALGVAPDEAARVATALLADPHPLVAAATAVWHTAQVDPAKLAGWAAALPSATWFGALPGGPERDEWARRHTFGQIRSFPVAPGPATRVMLASALATKVSWRRPFDVIDAAELGAGSPWAGRVERVLWRHGDAFIAGTDAAGDVAVQVAPAVGAGSELTVVSVAADPAVPRDRVLAAAYELVPAAARARRRRSLFDVPAGETALWSIEEHAAHDDELESVSAALPCWSARTEHDLSGAALGFDAVHEALEPLVGPHDSRAVQVATARFGREGFEAAAVTVYGGGPLAMPPPEGLARTAVLRFGHPFAVVAVASQRVPAEPAGAVLRALAPGAGPPPGEALRPGPWDGVPVFSAWVADIEEPE